MSNTLSSAVQLSPSSRPNSPPLTDAPTNLFGTEAAGDWVSTPYSVPGGPHGAAQMDMMFTFAFGTDTSIEILPEHASPDDPTTWYPIGRLNSSSQAENDVPILVPGTLLAGQDKIDLQFDVPAGHWVRVRARSLPAGTGSGSSLQLKVTAGPRED